MFERYNELPLRSCWITSSESVHLFCANFRCISFLNTRLYSFLVKCSNVAGFCRHFYVLYRPDFGTKRWRSLYQFRLVLHSPSRTRVATLRIWRTTLNSGYPYCAWTDAAKGPHPEALHYGLNTGGASRTAR